MVAAGDFFQIVGHLGRAELIIGEVLPAVADNAVFYGKRQVQPFAVVGQVFHHAVAVELVQKAFGADALVNGAFPLVAEGCVPDIMPQADGVGHIFAQFPIAAFIEPAANGGRNGGHVQDVFNAGADVVVIGGKKHLRFVLQASKRKRMNDFGLVAEIFIAQIGRVRMGAAEINFIRKRIFYHKIMIP